MPAVNEKIFCLTKLQLFHLKNAYIKYGAEEWITEGWRWMRKCFY